MPMAKKKELSHLIQGTEFFFLSFVPRTWTKKFDRGMLNFTLRHSSQPQPVKSITIFVL